MLKAAAEMVDAFELYEGEVVPGKTIESFAWTDRRHYYFLAKEYPNLARAVHWVLSERDSLALTPGALG